MLLQFGLLLAIAATGWVLTSAALITLLSPDPIRSPVDFLRYVVAAKEGWLFEDGQDAQLKEGILKAVSQRNQASQISEAAFETAKKRANWDLNFKLLLSAYEKAVQKS